MAAKPYLDILKDFAKLVRSEFSTSDIILYGSYARGNYDENSDIDIAVIVDSISADYLDLSSRLYELAWKIDNRIEPVLIIKSESRSGFLESILKYGIPA
ncbi:hypothetical protein MASR2M29_16840 [Spirochaetota bacterium]